MMRNGFPEHFGLNENNIIVVADDLMQESRQFRAEAGKKGTALEKIADRYINTKNCALIYDEKKGRGQMLCEMAAEYKADAVIYAQMKFCEMEEFDYPVLKKEMKEAGIKMLYIEADQQVESSGQLANRLQAFAEINAN